MDYSKLARKSALRMLAGRTIGDVDSIGSLAALKEKERRAMSIPLSTERGQRESLTKKLKPKLPKAF